MIYGIALVVIGVVLFTLARRKHRPSAGAVNGWKINWSHGLPDAPTPQGAGWVIDVPPGTSLHYVQRYGMKVREGQTLTARIRVTGSFASLEPGDASMSLLLQRKGSNGGPGYRYYSFPCVPLTEGEHELAVPVTAQHFGDVLKNVTTLSTVLAELESVGVMFGSVTDGRGHGVMAPSGGRVELLELSAI